jgi:hypothetical protein
MITNDDLMIMPLPKALNLMNRVSIPSWEARLRYKLWQQEKVKAVKKMVGLL